MLRVEGVEIRRPHRMMEKEQAPPLPVPRELKVSNDLSCALLNINSLTRRLHVSSGLEVRVSVLIRKRCEVPDLCSEGVVSQAGPGPTSKADEGPCPEDSLLLGAPGDVVWPCGCMVLIDELLHNLLDVSSSSKFSLKMSSFRNCSRKASASAACRTGGRSARRA